MDALWVVEGKRPWSVCASDAIAFLDALPEGCLDLVFFSPPYEEARLYLEDGRDLGVALKTDAWVEWLVKVFGACRRACKGLVACVCEGQTDNFSYSCSPFLLIAELRRAEFVLRKPPIYRRDGIPGSGGPDWLKNNWEPIVCTTRGGRLPYSNNTACGNPPKYGPGGVPSHRTKEGVRVNQQKAKELAGKGMSKRQAAREAGVPFTAGTSGTDAGGTIAGKTYLPPEVANPGNVILSSDVIDCVVGGGSMGEGVAFAKQGEAPFPESLPEFFVRSFCPPGGLCCDPFVGTGTTAAVAVRWGRRFVGCDLRPSQVKLTTRRIEQVSPELFPEG